MSFWLFLWILLCGALLYFFGWTNLILYRQKKAWRAYAEKLKLRYDSAGILAGPEIRGTIDGYSFYMFTDEHPSGDGRTNRKLVAIELDLHSELPMKGVVASGGMVNHIQNHISYKYEITPEIKGWKPTYMAQSENKIAMEKYLSDERLKSLMPLLERPNAWVVYLFQDDAALLRVDTPEPLDHPGKLDKLVRGMIKTAKILELGNGESQNLMDGATEKNTASKATVAGALDIDDEAMSSAAFELEEDEDNKS